jgi:hypothetical protein
LAYELRLESSKGDANENQDKGEIWSEYAQRHGPAMTHDTL